MIGKHQSKTFQVHRYDKIMIKDDTYCGMENNYFRQSFAEIVSKGCNCYPLVFCITYD